MKRSPRDPDVHCCVLDYVPVTVCLPQVSLLSSEPADMNEDVKLKIMGNEYAIGSIGTRKSEG